METLGKEGDMSIMIDVLLEEKERLEALIASYRNQIEELPRGSISWKKRGNGEYAYLAYREVKSVRFEYLGKRGSVAVETTREKVDQRRDLQDKCNLAEANLKQIMRMLRAAGHTV